MLFDSNGISKKNMDGKALILVEKNSNILWFNKKIENIPIFESNEGFAILDKKNYPVFIQDGYSIIEKKVFQEMESNKKELDKKSDIKIDKKNYSQYYALLKNNEEKKPESMCNIQ